MSTAGHPLIDGVSRPEPSRVPRRETLRERKKRLTREAIFSAARRMFGERGFDDVTVAEIADAANISVKTLFTYVRSKEELVFGDGPGVLDAVVAAVGSRRVGQTPLVAAANALLAAVDDEENGLAALHRVIDAGAGSGSGAGAGAGAGRAGAGRSVGAGGGSAARSRLRAMWDETEDALTETLTARGDGPRERAARRLVAAEIMVLVRTVTSPEVRDLVAGSGNSKKKRDDALRNWIRDAAGSLARGLGAAGAC